ncbi:dTDP-4-dehydrorhamnose reductase [Desulforamulus aquiferis]|uniref:dTDP-4-dehydrorhamnose reductase n=1 Tax=Desulforamulus aquiferis TaxID=1397668 RepID=A0AAW7ZHT2_9FIRM|nr:dTDP-4-dehydrorhamnose reductase [Desulforamulus aquiferis]MDO7788556.1 dTDP-4-dehydrorhamnose reductase [Desulforamulus aquiferis]RYD03779.1 hypothetical protein N752_18705 [Desulforamulus aquiferis]
MRILITGAGGMLGKDVLEVLSQRGCETLPRYKNDLDITELKQVYQCVENAKPDLIVNCAAYTNVDKAESERELALKINGLGVRNLALACQSTQIPLMHISTDYIFDGQKEEPYNIFDQPSPVNTYGWSKKVGEYYLTSLLSKFYLVRTSWLFGTGGGNFIETIIKLGQRQEELKVVDDQLGCPTFTKDLARTMADLIETGYYGTYHVTNQGKASWYQLAKEILNKCGSPAQIRAVKTFKYPRPAKRPSNSVLDPFPLYETLGYLLPHWQDALERYLELRREGVQ